MAIKTKILMAYLFREYYIELLIIKDDKEVNNEVLLSTLCSLLLSFDLESHPPLSSYSHNLKELQRVFLSLLHILWA